jgi:exopolyphosphatase/guanosine-5'-triphosphate,3'-diphosphate pyrophosphatase
MRELLEDLHAPGEQLPKLLENQIATTINHIQHQLSFRGRPRLVALGGDARFAADQLQGRQLRGGITSVPVQAMARLTRQLLRLSVDETVRKYHLSYPEAETLVPALLAYTRLAQAFNLQDVWVASTSLRDGLLADMAGEPWTDDFTSQITNSALELGRHYDFDEAHAAHVAGLAAQLFRALQREHSLPQRYEVILTVAALLHEIGLFVSNRAHHKHSMYLLRNSDVFGLGERDMLLVALVARYHRRGLPRSTHELYATLPRQRRLVVAKLAAILRVADALDRGHAGRVRRMNIQVEKGLLTITMPGLRDLAVEQLGLQQKGPMFEQVYGRKVLLRAGGETVAVPSE